MMDVVLQRTLVESALENCPLVKGATWCVMNKTWFDTFASFVSLNGAAQMQVSPGRITDDQLLEPDGTTLKAGLQEGEHYILIPKNVQELIHGWYGGSGPILRHVIEEGEGSKAILRVEVYLLKLRVVVCNAQGELGAPHVCFYSKKERVHELLKIECKRANLSETSVRVFTMDGEGDEILPETLLSLETTLEDAMLAPLQRVCLQHAPAGEKHLLLPTDRAGKKKPEHKGFFRRLFGRKEVSVEAVAPEEGVMMTETTGPVFDTSNVVMSEKGALCGLNNLGNTCFMNGAVQALLHCDPLVRYLLAGHYRKEINKKNPLGMKGELALALAELVKEVWRSASGTSVGPKQLKHVVGRFAPQFQGYQQHDSHELLAFLLDGVHEDLNRVHDKKFVDMEGMSEAMDDKERAKAMWQKHELRNRSVIVDLFQAQLKSTIVCPAVSDGGCGRHSVTFDAFAYLSLPVPQPESEKRFLEVAVSRDPTLRGTPWFSEMPIKYSVEVPVGELMSDVSRSLVAACASDPAQKHVVQSLTTGRTHVVICEQLNYKIYKSFASSHPACMVSLRDPLFGYELPKGSDTELYTYISFSHAKPHNKTSRMLEPFGLPFVVAFYIDVPTTVLVFYQTVYRAISCYFRESLWTTVGSPVFLGPDASSSAILEAKAELQRAGPPEGSVAPEGCWRVDHGTWHEEDQNKGKMALRYQVLKNKNTLTAFPFKLRWSCDSFNNTCVRCGERDCGGCDLVEMADERNSEDPERNSVVLLNLRGRLSMVVFWPDEEWRASTLEVGVLLNVRLNASVKTNRSVASNGGRKSSLTLQDCLTVFQQNEKLDRNNTWYCSTCKAHKEAWKMMQIYTLPTVLIIQLKRFRNQGGFRNKISVPVSFPLSALDMSQFVISHGAWMYDLFAVVNHHGDLGGGHYTAYAKQNITKQWYLFDDSRVTLVENESAIISPAAYILFYLKREEANL